jgi:hypothetical protein
MEAWDSPSALMTLARRSRSASTCRHRSVHRFGDPHDEQKLSVLRLRVLQAALVYGPPRADPALLGAHRPVQREHDSGRLALGASEG